MKGNYFLLLVQPNYVYFLYQWDFYLNQEASRRRGTKIIFDIILNLILPFWYLGKWHYTPPECRGEMNSLILSHPVEEKNPIAVFTSSRKEKSHGISFSFSFPLIILLPSPRLKYHGPATFLYYKVFTLHEHQLCSLLCVCSTFKFIMCTRVSTHSCSCM